MAKKRKLPKDVVTSLRPGEKAAPKLDLQQIAKSADAEGPLTPEELKRWGIAAEGPPEFIDDDPPEYLDEDDGPPEYLDEEEEEPNDFKLSAKGLLKSTAESLPAAGAIFGGAIGSPIAPPFGAVGGAGLGYGAGKAAENFIERTLLNEPKTRKEIWQEPLIAIPEGAAYEMGGHALGRGIKNFVDLGEESARMSRAPVKQLVKPERYTPPISLADDIGGSGFDPMPKPNAQEIRNSTQAIGAEAQPGMISNNPNIQRLEGALSYSPTKAGNRVQQGYEPVRRGLINSSENLVSGPPMTPVQAGQEARKGLMGKIHERMAPLEESFQNIKQSTTHITDPKAFGRTADRLLKQDLAEFPNLPQGKAIHSYAESIRNAKNLNSLKQLRTSAGQQQTAAYKTGNIMEAAAYGKVVNAIKRLERREVIKAAMKNSPTPAAGEAAARDLINQMKATNKGWRSLMTEVQKLAAAGGIKGKITSPR
jgi:hypothetical protein